MVSTHGIRTLWLTLATLLFASLGATAHAEVMDWPIGNTDASGTWVPGHGAYVQQNFENTTHPTHQGQPHAGIDLQLRDPATGHVSGPHTAGQSVRAAAGGYVEYRNPNANWPGGILALRHRDRKGNEWYTMYAHVDNLINVPVGTWVGRGSVIGTITNQEPQDPGNSHLHFEVRNEDGDSFPGAGYGGAGQNLENLGWFDPLDHYFTHRRACTGEGLHYTAPTYGMPIRSTPQVTGNNLVQTLPRLSTVQVEDVVPDAGGADNWWFKVSYRNGSQVRVGFTAAVADGGYGSVLNMVQRVRACQLVVPGFNNGSGRPWDTNLYIRNNGPLSQNVRVRIYHPNTTSGSFSQIYNIASNGSKKLSIGNNFENGTAVIESTVAEGTEDLSVVARHHVDNPGWAGGDAFSAYEAVRQGSAKQVVPVVHQNNWGWYNTITIYNPDTSTRHVDLNFTGASYCNQTNYSLGGRRTLVINTSAWKNGCLPYRYVGSLEITSTTTGGDPRPVMVASRQENRVGSSYESMATVSLTPSSKKLYLPLIQNQNYNYRAGLGAGRITGSGSLQADFRRADNGNSCLGETLSPWPVIETPFPTHNQGLCPNVISAHLELTGNGQMFAQFNQVYDPPAGDPNPNHDASSSPASAHPNHRAYVPYLDASSIRGIQIQNTEGDSTLVRLYFYNFSGNLVDFRTVNIQGYASATLVNQIPGSARNARIESDNRIVVLVNNVMNTGTQDDLMDYVAPSGVD